MNKVDKFIAIFGAIVIITSSIGIYIWILPQETVKKIGIEDLCIFLSVYQTCIYKEINFLDFLLSKKRDIDKFIMK